MADTDDNPSPAVPNAAALTPTPPKKPRGRPAGSKTETTPAKKPETPQQRIDRLKAELQKAEAEKAALEQQRDCIVGRVVVAHALGNPDYRRQLAALLKAEVKSKADLATLAELLT